MLVNCVVYQDGRKIADIAKEDAGQKIVEFVSRPDCFVWIALVDPTPLEMDELATEFNLHPLAVEDAKHGHQRPKIEEYEDSLFVVLQMIEKDATGADAPYRVGEVAIFVGKNYIVSVRHRAYKGFADVRARCEREPELLRHGSGFVLYALMDAVVDRYFPILDELESLLESAEDKLFATTSSRSKIEELYELKRHLMLLKHAVSPLMEAVGRLYGGRVPQLCASLTEYYRDVNDHLARINAEIENMRDMLTTATQVIVGLINLNETEVTKKLAGWAAILAVPTLIAGIYGMNFKFIPEYEWDLGYPFALALMFGIDAFLYIWFKRIRWL